MTKPIYKSGTIQAGVAGFAILLIQTGYSMWNADTGKFRSPTQVEVAAVLGGLYTLREVIEGRKRATEDIGKPDAYELPETFHTPAADNPDLSQVDNLPSAEFAYQVEPMALLSPDDESVDADEDDTFDIDWESLKGKYYLTAQVNSKLKTSTDQSEQDNVAWVDVEKEQRIFIDTWNFLKKKNSHIQVSIDEYKNINDGIFYVYAPHFKLFNSQGKSVEIESSTAAVPVIKKNLTPLRLPGYNSLFYLENPIYSGSHFTWREATRGGTRMPSEKRQVDNIMAVARKLDLIREFNGNKPMTITSWLRPNKPIDINRRVGGASRSRHITGDGVDFTVIGANMFDVQERMKSFCRTHNMGLGLGAKSGFVHTDLNGFRVWSYA